MKLYAFSDQHGKLDFELPNDGLILCAGDVCPDFAPGTPFGSSRQESWLHDKWARWVGNRFLLATFGNHDFVRQKEAPFKRFVVDGARSITDGKTSIKVWFSPWSNTFGDWAWMRASSQLAATYAAIPDDVDIIVSHQPPYAYGDRLDDRYLIGERSDEDPHAGSKELLDAIDRVKPKVVICGHIHSGFGVYEHRTELGLDMPAAYHRTTIYNVSLVNEEYKRVNPVTEIDLSFLEAST